MQQCDKVNVITINFRIYDLAYNYIFIFIFLYIVYY